MTQILLKTLQEANKTDLDQASKNLAKHLKQEGIELSTVINELPLPQQCSLVQQVAIQSVNENLDQTIALVQDFLNSVEDQTEPKLIALKRYLATVFLYSKKTVEAGQLYDEIFAATPKEEQDLNFLFNKWQTELKYADQTETLWQVWQAILDETIQFETNTAKDLANRIFALYKGLPEELHRDHRRFSDHMFMHQSSTKHTHLINYLAELDIA